MPIRSYSSVAFVAGLALLLVHNLYSLGRNQSRGSCYDRVCIGPRTLERVAWKSRNPKISSLGIFFLLNQRIPRAKLTIPPAWEHRRRDFRRLSRLGVRVSDQRLLVDEARIDQLDWPVTRRQRAEERQSKSEPRGIEEYVFLFDKAATDYVVAENAGGDRFFVMPRAAYLQVGPR